MNALDDLTRWASEVGEQMRRRPRPDGSWVREFTSERLAELGVVPRAEFDAQARVLERQAARIAELERRIAELETELQR